MNIHFANRPGPVTAISKPYSDIPHPSGPDYIDRPIITDWLQQELNKSPSRAALVGLGGIGKSKLAIRYAEQVCKESPDTYIFWVNSATKDTFVQGFRRISEKLGLPNEYGVGTDMLRQVFNWLRDGENGPWVMILDNADDYFVFRNKRTNSDVTPAIDSGMLDSFLPQTGNGRILITSRSLDTARILALSLDNTLVVPEMEENQARLLFRRKLGDLGESDEISRRVVLTLNCIPLCISQAAAYIQNLQPRMTCAKYLEKFNGRNFVFLSSRDSEGRYNPDAKNKEVEIKTWQITFNQIRDERQSAAGLLSLMSFFQPQGIPEWVLQKHYSEMVNENSSIDIGHNGEDEFENDLTLLRDYSLVTVAEDAKSFQMHSLVQSFTRSWLEASHEDHKWRRCFQQLMIKSFPEDWLENWSACGELTPHIEPLVNTTACQLEDGGETIRFLELLRKVGGYKHATAMYETALKIFTKAEQLAVQKLGEDHEQVYKIAASKAPSLGNSGSVAAAEAAALEAYKGLTRILGVDNPTTRYTGKIYASSLEMTGKLDEAQAIYLEVLESQKRVTNSEFIGLGVTLMGLGNIAYRTRHHAEAERLYSLAYQSGFYSNGLTSPFTITSLGRVALVLVAQEKWAEAEPIIDEAVEQHIEVMGPDHPNTLEARSLQASKLVYQKRFREAEDMLCRVLEAKRKVLGPEHPSTISTLMLYRDVLTRQGK
ncbi:hypothetical protein GE21DRAFT_145 [Neurospora crassa]|uniref:DUF7779 domain-containing protein n=1 Tax=Neurospora crassa (strain ATCC 24698 / 74-OR23-1A / CBS 708.71 / DSM 1257 / FGSC 987) TaxID=367110 RepID=Q7SD43_NEUCR|nr:hypothetical protein NCU07463 [Neurospora crassa OR74A]EAA34678.2 hypothetical protein NCU07463 [Neurospora crassa OR74A]KHE79698.1 hypothetical protein GE21DRAFT_145 [Neurospora crassa]|eukprot:XP_963914.2 hypothetical protein NCU07463 [Neurospora crassa OR74A]